MPATACRQRAVLPPDLLLAVDTAYSYSLDVLNPKALESVRQRDNWQGRGEFYSFEVAMKVGAAVAGHACMIIHARNMRRTHCMNR